MKFYQEKWFCILMLIMFFPVGIYLMFWYKHFNKVARIIITVFFAFSIVICFTDTDSNMELTQNTETTQNQNQIEIDNEELLKQIKVSAEVQNVFDEGKQKVVFAVKNESDYVFNGTVSVKLKDLLDNTVYRDLIFIEDLNPKLQTYAIVWAKPGFVKYEYSVDGNFKVFESVHQKSIDEFKNKLNKITVSDISDSYKIVYTEYIRYDGAPTYYVLINEINLDNDNFKKEIKNIIIDILKKYGTKININIYDNLDVLKFDHDWNKKTMDDSNYSSLSKIEELQIERQKNEDKLARHYILHFIGENEVCDVPYEIFYFPCASNDTPEVGKYVEIKEFTID